MLGLLGKKMIQKTDGYVERNSPAVPLEGFHLDRNLGFSMQSVAVCSAVSLLVLSCKVWRTTSSSLMTSVDCGSMTMDSDSLG